jgi:short-subunit dehydrogenase
VNGHTAAVIGAGRGLGRATAITFAAAGSTVIAVARTANDLTDLQQSQPTPSFIEPIPGDALEPDTAALIIDRQPDVVVLVAGATPTVGPFDEQSWTEFAVNWETDVRMTHLWLTAVLRAPLHAGSRVIVVSSGAAVGGSPLSGGYAGAKATQRFLVGYAQEEAGRRGLGISFTAVLPRMTPLTHVGEVAVAAYSAREGVGQAEYVARLSEPLTPEAFGHAVYTLAHMDAHAAEGSFLLTATGLTRIP